MKTHTQPTSKETSPVLGIVLATLLALAAIVSAVLNPTDLSGRPVSHATMVASAEAL